MKIIKQMIAGIIIVFICLALGVTGAFLLVDNSTLIEQVCEQIESATGTRISYGEGASITRTLSPMITIQDLNIENTTTQMKIHTSLFQLQISLPGLMKGNLEIPKLVVGDTRVEINESDGGGNGDSDGESILPRSFFLKPVLNDIQISQISIIRANEKMSLPAVDIKQFTVKTEPGTDKLICNLKTQTGDTILDVAATLPSIQEILEQHRLPFSLAVMNPFLNLSSEGLIDFRSSPPTIEARVQADVPDVARIPAIKKGFPVSGKFSGTAQISGTSDRLGIRECSLSVKTVNELDLNMVGQLDVVYGNAGLPIENMDFKLNFTTPNTHLAQAFLFDKIPKSGIIQGSARVHSTKGTPSLDDIVVQTRDVKGIQLDLKGRIENLFALTGFDLNLNGTLEKPDFLAKALPESLDPLSRIRLSTRISGAYPRLGIRECQLHAKTVKEFELNVAGQLDLAHGNAGLPIENLDLKLQFSAPDTRSARVIFFDTIPEFGAVQGQAEIRSTKGAAALEKIVVQTRDAEGIHVDLTGRINSFPFDPDLSNTGYDLDVIMTSAKTAVMGERLGIDIPIDGPLEIRYRIEGDTQSLRLEKIDLSAGEKNEVQVNTSGRILFGKWDQTDPIERIDLAVGLNSQTTRALGEKIGKHLPELGRVTARARLHTVSKNHQIDDVLVRVIDKKPVEMTVKGSAEQVVFFPEPAVKKIGLVVTASGDTAALLTNIFSLQMAVPAIGNFKASARITGNKQIFGIKDLSIVAGLDDTDKNQLNLSVTGRMDDVRDMNTLSLNASGIARDLQTIGAVLGQEWPETGPVKLDSSILKKENGIEFDARMTAGETRMDTIISMMPRRGIPLISGKISAQNLFLPSMFEKKNKPPEDGPPGTLSFFSREPLALDWMEKVDLDLLVDIASFDPERENLESARFKINLDSGQLAIESGRIVFPKGEIIIDVHLEQEKDLKLSITAAGKDIDPMHTLSIQEKSSEKKFNTNLDIDIDITSSGASEYELLANMDGNIYILLKNGRIKKAPLDLLFIDFIGWTIGKTVGNKYLDITCGVGDYQIKKGVITTNAFIIDTKNITIAGEGVIDLAQEHIAYAILPKKKSRLILKAEPVKVNGPLSNPTVTVLPWKSAATTYGSLFFGPYVFAGVTAFDFLSGILKEKVTTSPCLEYEKKHDQATKKGYDAPVP